MAERLLLDTHALIWAVNDPSRIPKRVFAKLADEANEIVISAASAWEVATKVRLGRLPAARALMQTFDASVRRIGGRHLAISTGHALDAGSLDWPHRDPFDRLLVAQAIKESLTIVTRDRAITGFDGVATLW
jgi:PIN domain nuclease of toxin-antitoxin system